MIEGLERILERAPQLTPKEFGEALRALGAKKISNYAPGSGAAVFRFDSDGTTIDANGHNVVAVTPDGTFYVNTKKTQANGEFPQASPPSPGFSPYRFDARDNYEGALSLGGDVLSSSPVAQQLAKNLNFDLSDPKERETAAFFLGTGFKWLSSDPVLQPYSEPIRQLLTGEITQEAFEQAVPRHERALMQGALDGFAKAMLGIEWLARAPDEPLPQEPSPPPHYLPEGEVKARL